MQPEISQLIVVLITMKYPRETILYRAYYICAVFVCDPGQDFGGDLYTTMIMIRENKQQSTIIRERKRWWNCLVTYWSMLYR